MGPLSIEVARDDILTGDDKMEKTVLMAMVPLVSIMLVAVGIRGWESAQPCVILNNARVERIIPYSLRGGDLHWSYKGNRVYIAGDERPIDFSARRWNDRVRTGDEVSIVVRKSFFSNELDGLAIQLKDASVNGKVDE